MPLVTKTFSEIITFTRASSGTYFDATGTLQTATTNAARFDYDPSTLSARGFLVEEQRTNSIRNNTMVGAVAGTPGTPPTNWAITFNTTTGVSSQIVGTGTENGITYIDIRFNGTASGAGSVDLVFEAVNGIAALTGQNWASSVYWKLQAGTFTGLSNSIFYGFEYTSGSVFIKATSFGSISAPTAASLNSQRFTGSATLSGGATTAFVRPLIKIDIANASVVDVTLRIGLPQLEQGAFATSVIPTTTAATTRSADIASIGTLSPWYNATEGTLYGESVISRVPSIAGTGIAQFDDGTSSNRIRSRRYISRIPSRITQSLRVIYRIHP